MKKYSRLILVVGIVLSSSASVHAKDAKGSSSHSGSGHVVQHSKSSPISSAMKGLKAEPKGITTIPTNFITNLVVANKGTTATTINKISTAPNVKLNATNAPTPNATIPNATTANTANKTTPNTATPNTTTPNTTTPNKTTPNKTTPNTTTPNTTTNMTSKVNMVNKMHPTNFVHRSFPTNFGRPVFVGPVVPVAVDPIAAPVLLPSQDQKLLKVINGTSERVKFFIHSHTRVNGQFVWQPSVIELDPGQASDVMPANMIRVAAKSATREWAPMDVSLVDLDASGLRLYQAPAMDTFTFTLPE